MTVQFLKELIEKNARVIIPEFGAFLVKDDGTGVFKAENISFSPFLRYNDGMLEDTLASSKSISKEESGKQIKQFVESIKDQLLNSNQFVIEGLGYLYRDNRGGVHFSSKPLEKDNQKPKEAAKQESKVKAVAKTTEIISQPEEVKETQDVSDSKTLKEPEKKIVSKPQPKPPVRKTTPKPVHHPKPQTKQPEVRTKEPKPVSSSDGGAGKAILMGSLIGLAVVIIVAGGWYLAKNGYLNFGKDKTITSENVELQDSNDEISTEVAVKQQPVKEQEGKFDGEFSRLSQSMDKTETKTPEPKVKSEAPKVVEVPTLETNSSANLPKDLIPTSDGPFHLIVGSFRNSEYAEKFSNDMKRSGYNSTIVIQQSGMHSVTLGSYSTRQDAMRAMDQFKSQHPNVWILMQ